MRCIAGGSDNMLGFLSKNLVYPLYWHSRRLDVKNRLGALLDNQWRSAEELEQMQWNSLRVLLNHAYANVPYYGKIIGETFGHPDNIRNLDDFAQLPILEKRDINHHSSSLVARNFNVGDMIADSTGGSTGETVRYFEDRNELSQRFAAAIRSDMWAGLKPGDRHAQIWGSVLDLDKESAVKRLIDKMLLRRLFISSFRLSDAALEKALHQIRDFRPQTLIGYPTPLYRLAHYIEESNSPALQIASIISSSETLHDDQRETIERVFGCRIFNRYGCREFGPLAAECEMHQGLHFFTDRFIVELLPHHTEDNKEYCELVITDLHKFGMPFIRYRIGDLCVRAVAACECGRGFPVIERIAGRSFDLIQGTNGNYVAGTFWTLLFRSVPGIIMFQVVQKSRDRIVVLLETDGRLSQSSRDSLQAGIRKKCGDDMQVDIEVVPRIECGSSGKHRLVICELKEDVAR